MAFVVGLLIVRTAVEVFVESAFQLTDGFDQTELDNYIPKLSYDILKWKIFVKLKRVDTDQMSISI